MHRRNTIKIKPICWLLIAEIAVLLVGLLLGFRITYAPELENSWDAISACAAWTGVIASFVAILVAVRIPKVIADRQDKIALFEKRFAFYDVLSRCISFSKFIGNIQTHREIQIFFVASFGRERMEECTQDALDRNVLKLENEAVMILKQGAFLFDLAPTPKNHLELVTSTLVALLSISENHDRFWQCYGEYMEAINIAKCDLLPMVEDTLRIGK